MTRLMESGLMACNLGRIKRIQAMAVRGHVSLLTCPPLLLSPHPLIYKFVGLITKFENCHIRT